MQRLYFVVPSVQLCRSIVNELLLARVEERHMHVLAKDDNIPADLPKASLLQKSDIVPAIERGITIGGGTGLFAGLMAYLFQSAGVEFGGILIMAICLAGGGIGAWIAGMIGVDVPNTQLKAFERDLESGALLLIVDVPRSRVREIEQKVHNTYPDVRGAGVEKALPVFP